MKLRAVFFDIDDTLYSTSSFAARARLRAVEAMVKTGLQVPVATAFTELNDVVREFSSNYGHHFEKLLLRFPHALKPGVHWSVVVAAGVVAYHGTKMTELRAFPGAGSALEELRRMGLILGVISNGITVKQAEKLVRLGLHEQFSPDAIFISEDVAIAKPNPKLFRMACERLGVRPEEALYVGDKPQTDIDPAHEAGLWTCLRVSEGGVKKEPGIQTPTFTTADLEDLPRLVRERFDLP